jgi:hypothetical protein
MGHERIRSGHSQVERMEHVADVEQHYGFLSSWNLPLAQYPIDWAEADRNCLIPCRQDHTLIHLLHRDPLQFWCLKAQWIAAAGGMILALTHPDYMVPAST